MTSSSSIETTDGRTTAMSADQCRAARGFLGWSLDETATRSGVNRNTIHNFETGKRDPHPGTVAALRSCFETAGLCFTADAAAESVTRHRSD